MVAAQQARAALAIDAGGATKGGCGGIAHPFAHWIMLVRSKLCRLAFVLQQFALATMAGRWGEA
ncbi:hypothetical protein [Ramlibacter sp.]|uniref:hypothetical protein n=1 Tax=Ramlibacter sp. TaxID=1917967 RepID=UPI00261091AF|nr:hypothetical protein [Ramlibacter sp.]